MNTLASNWPELAGQALKAGYLPGNQWETFLRKATPLKLQAELGANLEPYLQARTHQAQLQYIQMTEQGTPPQTARELVLSDLAGNDN